MNPDDYIGADSKEAKEQLKTLGLSVDEETVAGGDKDIVADVEPSGDVEPASEATLYIYEGTDESQGRGEDQDDDSPGRSGERKRKGKD